MNTPPPLNITLTFTPEDLEHLRASGIRVPNLANAQAAIPVVGDVLRFGGLAFVITARTWEHDGSTPLLRLYLSDRQQDKGKPVH